MVGRLVFLGLVMVGGLLAGFGTPGQAGPPRLAGEGGPGLSEQAPADSFLSQFAATSRFRRGRPASIAWTPDDKSVLFLRSGPRSFVQDLWQYDVATGRERVILTADSLLGGGEEKLSVEELARRERQRQTARGIASFQL
jgi:dipeptidyl-peptidase-4